MNDQAKRFLEKVFIPEDENANPKTVADSSARCSTVGTAGCVSLIDMRESLKLQFLEITLKMRYCNSR